MPLAVGAKLGPYVVVELVGAGGMGEVYRARDPRLGRDVAVKVLPSEVASSPERLARFEREARAAAALNHPNILTVYDVGSTVVDTGNEGSPTAPTPYVVAELLQGETLRELLRQHAPTRRQILSLAAQVARGLEAAHAKGLVHRDVKPENLFVTTDGRVKVLDFGLAKLADALGGSEAATDLSPTADGEVVGTLAYMSPEQVRGLSLDRRTDIFSFGVVLYELLEGRHPFRRSTRVATLMAILEEEPPPLGSSSPVPLALGGILRRCLEKNREERFESARDLAFALEAVLQAPAAAGPRDVEERSPYPGLASFTERDASVFFGREREVAALWDRLLRLRLLAVIGPSGAGKSSFLRAGVAAARPAGWGWACATPGSHPALGLARALTPALAGDAESIGEMLAGVGELVQRGASDRLVDAVRRWRGAHAEALLVVDQFEELFTMNAPEMQRAFASLLGRLASEADVHLVLSLRDDFLMRCHEHEALAPVFRELTPLGPMGPEALRCALVEPARGRGYAFEAAELVDDVVAAVSGARATLPLLAFAVARLWEARDRDRKLLTRARYDELGGVAGALAQHAEATIDRIGAGRLPVVREVFRNLVTAQGTRQIADRDELLSAFPSRDDAEEVLRALVDARLLTTYEPEEGAGETGRGRLEIVHESLLTAWPRLVKWRAQDEEGAVLRDQLRQAARLWDQKDRTSDLLWTGTAFREFELWREQYKGGLTAVEEAFARAMAERARRKKRVLTAVAAAAVIVSAAVTIAVGLSRRQAVLARERAEAEAQRAEASKLLAIARTQLDVDPTVALAYARRSLDVRDTAEARRFVIEALWRGPVARVVAVPGGNCLFVAASPDGKWLACSGWGRAITLLSADGRTTRVLDRNRDAARMRLVLFSRDSRRLATFADGDPETLVWSVEGDEVARLRPGGFPRWFEGDEIVLAREEPRRHAIEFVARRIGRDGERSLGRGSSGPGGVDLDRARGTLVYGSGRTVLERAAGAGPAAVPVKVGEHGDRVTDVRFFDEPRRIVSLDARGQARVFDAGSRRLLGVVQGLDPDRTFSMPVLDRGGSLLAWLSVRQRAFPVWNLADPPDVSPHLMHAAQVRSDGGDAAFVGDARWLATAVSPGLALWPLGMPWPRVIHRPDTGFALLAFTPDSRQLVVCSNTLVRAYPMTPDAPPAYSLGPNDFACYGVAMDPSGSRIVMAATAWGLFDYPIGGGERRTLLRVPPTESIMAIDIDESGRWAATAACYSPDPMDRLLHVVDRRSGQARAYPLPESAGPDPGAGTVVGVRFIAGGRLVTQGAAGILEWDPATGAHRKLHPGPCHPMAASRDGRVIVSECSMGGRRGAAVSYAAGNGLPQPTEVVAIDATTGVHRTLPGFGRDLTAMALDPSARVLAAIDSTGSVRVGRLDGGEPHLLPDAGGTSLSLAFSPDGRWLAATPGNDVRLWPVPDVSKPPLHTWPREALLARLDALTNVRVVADSTSPSGYEVDLAPFPGWLDTPAW